jgi:hypothetical protein
VSQLPRQYVCETKKLVWNPSFPLNKVLVYDTRMLPTKLQSNLQTLGFSGVDIREKMWEWQTPRECKRDFTGWCEKPRELLIVLQSRLYSREISYSHIFSRRSTPKTIMPLWLKKLVWGPSFILYRALVYDSGMFPTKLQSNLQTMTFSGVDIRENMREWLNPRENMLDLRYWHLMWEVSGVILGKRCDTSGG